VWSRRFAWSLLFSIPIFLLSMVFPYIPPVRRALNADVGGFYLIQLLKWALATPVQVHTDRQTHGAGAPC
jgi:P-type Cu+ transporter